MAYSTIETLSKKIDQRKLVDYVNDEQRPDTEIELESEEDICVVRINQVCTEVAEEIDNSLRGRYKLPLTTIPGTIQTISDDRVIYNLKLRRHRDDMSETEMKIYSDSTKRLQRIQEGKELLDLELKNAEAGAGQIFTNKKSRSEFSKLLDTF